MNERATGAAHPLVIDRPGLVAASPRREARIIAVTLVLVAIMVMASGMMFGPVLAYLKNDGQFRQAYTDSQFYRDVIADVHAGKGYYLSALRELASHGRSVAPVLVVRPPTLAETVALIGPRAAAITHMLLAAAAAAALWLRLHSMQRSVAFGICAAGAILMGWYPSMTGITSPMMHEQWSGLLCVLALSARTERRWVASILLALAAVALRETAMSLVGAMLLMAVVERGWREAGAWCTALALCMIAGLWHMHLYHVALGQVAATVPPLWWGGGMGFGYFTTATAFSTALDRLPLAVGALLVGGGMIGWMSRTDPFSRRVTLHLAIWVCVMAIVARPENFYWTPMYAMLVPTGLLFLPTLSREARQAFGKMDAAQAS